MSDAPMQLSFKQGSGFGNLTGSEPPRVSADKQIQSNVHSLRERGETERQRDRETERQRDRETERQRDNRDNRGRERDREKERQRDRETERQRDRETERQ